MLVYVARECLFPIRFHTLKAIGAVFFQCWSLTDHALLLPRNISKARQAAVDLWTRPTGQCNVLNWNHGVAGVTHLGKPIVKHDLEI